jgi:hypothetical protein
MTADDLIDRPDNTTPFIGRPRRQLINSDAFQTACALPELDRYEELAVSLEDDE